MQGPMVIGEGNDFWPFSCIGVAPQTSHFDPSVEGPGTVIGDQNVFREHSSVHRSIHETDPTRIGDRNLFMDSAHAGHDVVMGNGIVLANGSALGGHVIVEDDVIIGGNAAVHQFVRVGRGAMMSGLAGTALDVMPWFMVTRLNVAGSFNVIGLRRQGFSREDIHTVRWVYRLFCRNGHTVGEAIEQLNERKGEPVVDALRATGAMAAPGLVAMIDGWEVLVVEEEIDAQGLNDYAVGRGGGTVCAASRAAHRARLISARRRQQQPASRCSGQLPDSAAHGSGGRRRCSG